MSRKFIFTYFYQITIANQFYTMVLQILMGVRIAHELILPNAVTPATDDGFHFIIFDTRMHESFRDSLRNIDPNLQNFFAVVLIAGAQILGPIKCTGLSDYF